MKFFEYLGLFITITGLLYISVFSKEPANLFSYTAMVIGATMGLTSFTIRMFDKLKGRKEKKQTST